ncbi:hypothetical protein [Streptomyces liangshanensis]|uniref:Lipoprotein n=1 Tax=Streptomyces liangshanensis TaxID=2717324 RepID=A0A6G9H1W4_9ACTN|nr:hypothetical protein [Streptomyces liangshanensis]QIQ04464.1 hypothetical protein HA039_21105 [Streptomyces liangshanensis]
MSATRTTHSLRRSALGAVCAVAVLTLSACGILDGDTSGGKDKPTEDKSAPFAGLSGPEIAKKAVAANLAASSMTVHSDSRADGDHTVFTVAMSRQGDCTGTQTINDGGVLTLTRVGGDSYQMLDEELVRADNKGQPKEEVDNAVKVLADLWTKDSPEEAKQNADFCDLHSLLSSFQGAGSLAQKGPVTTVDGVPAITLTESDTEGTYTMYVATQGKPYLLKYVEKTKKDPGTTAFSDFDKPVPAKAPAKKDMVDVSLLAN